MGVIMAMIHVLAVIVAVKMASRVFGVVMLRVVRGALWDHGWEYISALCALPAMMDRAGDGGSSASIRSQSTAQSLPRRSGERYSNRHRGHIRRDLSWPPKVIRSTTGHRGHAGRPQSSHS